MARAGRRRTGARYPAAGRRAPGGARIGPGPGTGVRGPRDVPSVGSAPARTAVRPVPRGAPARDDPAECLASAPLPRFETIKRNARSLHGREKCTKSPMRSRASEALILALVRSTPPRPDAPPGTSTALSPPAPFAEVWCGPGDRVLLCSLSSSRRPTTLRTSALRRPSAPRGSSLSETKSGAQALRFGLRPGPRPPSCGRPAGVRTPPPVLLRLFRAPSVPDARAASTETRAASLESRAASTGFRAASEGTRAPGPRSAHLGRPGGYHPRRP